MPRYSRVSYHQKGTRTYLSLKITGLGSSACVHLTGDFSHILWPRCCCLHWYSRIRTHGVPAVLTPLRPRSTLAPTPCATGSLQLNLRKPPRSAPRSGSSSLSPSPSLRCHAPPRCSSCRQSRG